MARLTKQRIAAVQLEVLAWYAANKRDLPWRRTRNPYAILVSEIMLLQTQVSRVIPKYEAFLAEFPTLQALAAASPAAVIRSWKGLGYNRRALNLQRAARAVVDEYRGQFPPTPSALMKLPGIGRYTAGAVSTFAFGVITPAVDTNVKQFIDQMIPSRAVRTELDYYRLADQLIPADQPAVWLHAVMDFVALQPERFRRSRLSLTSRRDRVGRSPKARLATPKEEPFIGSNRYLRGRIIDCLRERPESADTLFARIGAPLEVSRERFDTVLGLLAHDGMIEHHRTRYQLPEG